MFWCQTLLPTEGCNGYRTMQHIMLHGKLLICYMQTASGSFHFPAKSPDLNPIEHLWDPLKRRVRSLPKLQNLAELEKNVLRVWQNLRQQDFCNHILSMRSRRNAVIAAVGGHTRY